MREAGVAQYADAKVSITMAEFEDDDEAEEAPKAPTPLPAAHDPMRDRLAGILGTDYQKAFGVK